MSTRQREERTAGWVYVPDEYRERSFTAAELAEVAAGLEGQQAAQGALEGAPLSDLNERLVRYYVAEGVLDRPDRQGRGPGFDFRHLVQLQVVRKLQREMRLSLAEIRERIAAMPWERVDEWMDRGAYPEASTASVATSGAPRRSRPISGVLAGAPLAPDAEGPGRWQSGSRSAQEMRRECVEVNLPAGCRVLIDLRALEALSDADIERSVQAVRRALFEERNRVKKGVRSE